MGFKPRLGWPILILISLSPILFWASSIPLNFRFTDFYSTFKSIGQILGLVGMVMFSLDMFLSGRFKFIEDYFGGMNKVYIAHHILGSVSFILLMFHPISLAIAVVPTSIKTVLTYIIPGLDWTINLGIITLLLLMALLILTLFINLPYEFWKKTHKYLGAVLVLGVIHSLFVPSDLSRDPVFRNYMLLLMSLGLIPYLYRTVFYRFFIKRIDYSISEIDYISPNVIEILMTPIRENLSYMPGQFVFVDFDKSNLPAEIHPFSLTSSPTDNHLSFAAKIEGDFTKKLMKVNIDSIVKVEGGFGRFSYLLSPTKEQVWIAGGIGITPFISMAKSLINNYGYSITLYYSVKNKDEVLYFNKLQKLSANGLGLTFIPWYSQEKGRLSAKAINDLDSDLFKKDIYICGPPPMMKGLIDQLVQLRVKKSHIHSEEFAMS